MKLRVFNVPFTQIPNKVLTDKNLSWRAKGVFAYLQSKADGWDFSSERIAEESCGGLKSTRKALKELEDNGYLERKKLSNGKMEYQLKYGKNKHQSAQMAQSQNGTEPKWHRAKRAPISNKEEENNKEEESNKEYKEKESNKEKEKNKESDSLLEEKLEEKFERFWKEYPKKIAKPMALKAFIKINPDEELLREMLSKLSAYKETDQWQKDKGRFIPHPATWLNQERWQDVLDDDNEEIIVPEYAKKWQMKK